MTHHAPQPHGQTDRRRAAPLDPTLLDWITEQNRRAAISATRRTLRRSTVGFLILFAATMGVYQNGQHVGDEEREAIVDSGKVVSVDGCNRDFRDGERLMNLLERLKQANTDTYNRVLPADRTVEIDMRYKDAQAFYAAEIARAKRELPDCREAERIVTDDPDADLRRIKPLYPGAPG